MFLSKLHALLVLLLAAILTTASCDLADSGSDGPKRVSVNMAIQSSVSPKFKAAALDSLTEVKLLVEELELESVNDDSADFEVENLIVNLPLNGDSVQLSSQLIPAGMYDEFEMEIEHDDEESEISDPDFSEGDEEYSIVIRGVYNGEDFLFRSQEDFEIEMDLNPPLEITENGNSVNVNININPSSWFVDSQGNPLDPSDPANREQIEENIENSFDAETEEDDDDDDDNDDGDDDDDSDD